MATDTEIKNAVSATDREAQYDEQAKRLIGNKIILAHILVKTVDEFYGMNPKDEPASYYILNRVVFCVSRLVFSQKERDFVKTNYNDIRRVFSIWVCMNMDENSMAYVHLVKDDLLSSYQWKGGLDLLNIVMIGIANEFPEYDEKYELHRLLNTILSMELSADEKLGIMETEYHIPVDDKMRKDVSAMCNLSQGIKENGIAIGKAEVVINMHKKGYTSKQIAEIVEKSIEEVEAIIEKNESVLV